MYIYINQQDRISVQNVGAPAKWQSSSHLLIRYPIVFLRPCSFAPSLIPLLPTSLSPLYCVLFDGTHLTKKPGCFDITVTTREICQVFPSPPLTLSPLPSPLPSPLSPFLSRLSHMSYQAHNGTWDRFDTIPCTFPQFHTPEECTPTSVCPAFGVRCSRRGEGKRERGEKKRGKRGKENIGERGKEKKRERKWEVIRGD